jgi:SAM-dependent methyltransferase
VKQLIQQSLLDPLQFRFDVFPGLKYQPLPWIGFRRASRGAGTMQRWDAMKPRIAASGSRTALDVGCNVGFFCFAMAEMGLSVTGVDGAQKELRIAGVVRRKLRATNVGLLSLQIDPANVTLLPPADAVLLLSVWHHWVKSFGLEAATAMLRSVWERCGKVLFFETGETEMPADYRLPAMVPSARDWVAGYLAHVCAPSRVEWVGQMKAFAPGGSETAAVVQRNLFAVAR